MSNKYLKFISDKDYEKCIHDIYIEYKRNLDDINIFHNEKNAQRIPDPIGALLFAYFNEKINSYDDWVIHEKSRLAIKSFEQLIGYFHENLIDKIDGWKKYDVGAGYDVRNDEKKIIADIKNKYNTEKGNKQFGVYEELEDCLNQIDDNYTAYYVTIIPGVSNRRINKPFTPSGKPKNNKIIHVDGYTFYNIATGREKALKEIYKSLPDVLGSISDISNRNNFSHIDDMYKVLFYNAFKKKILDTPINTYLSSIEDELK